MSTRSSATRNCGSCTTLPSTRTQPSVMYCSASRREQGTSAATAFDRRFGSSGTSGTLEEGQLARARQGFELQFGPQCVALVRVFADCKHPQRGSRAREPGASPKDMLKKPVLHVERDA